MSTETPIFDALMREHGLVHLARPLGSLDAPRIEPLPPLTTEAVAS